MVSFIFKHMLHWITGPEKFPVSWISQQFKQFGKWVPWLTALGVGALPLTLHKSRDTDGWVVGKLWIFVLGINPT